MRRSAFVVAVLAAGCAHVPPVAQRALVPPRGSVAPESVRLSGGSATDRSVMRTALRGFGRSEILALRIAGPPNDVACDAAHLHVSARPEIATDNRDWWEAEVIAGALRRRGLHVCAVSVRKGSRAEEDAGMGTPEYPRASATADDVLRAVQTGARAAKLRVVGVVFHRPAGLVPEVALLARDPRDFERRMQSFTRAFFSLAKHLDGSYVGVRNSCGRVVWLTAGSNATGAGSAYAGPHWICPFGDLLNQRCPKQRATASNPCL